MASFSLKNIALTLLGINLALFAIQVLVVGFTEQFLLLSSAAFSEPWRIITAMFLHGSVTHLFYNMFALFLFGMILEKTIGSRRFIVLYFGAGIIASLVSIPLYPAALGASGAIFGVLGAVAVLKPRMIVYLGFIPLPMALAAVVWVAGDLVGLFAPSGTANAAHLGGIALGVAYGFYLRYRYDAGDSWGGHKKRHIHGEPTETDLDNWEQGWM